MSICDEINARLFELRDEKYRDFHAKLVPNISPERIIGVRTPALRKLAGELFKDERIGEFLKELPHKYYDETNLHGFIICKIKDYDQCVFELDRLLTHVDNWATCDLLSPVCFKKNYDRLMTDIKRWIASDEVYTKRFGVEMLMSHFLDENFKPEYLEMAVISSEEYYINMMTAWFFATALAKQYDATLPYIQNRRLEKWTHNKAIQKAIESYRITDEQKSYLKTLKVK